MTFSCLSLLLIVAPTVEDWDMLEKVEFTSPNKYDPSRRIWTRQVTTYTNDDIARWRKNLGYPPTAIVKKTLQNTSQLIRTVEAEQRELMRDHRVAQLLPLCRQVLAPQ